MRRFVVAVFVVLAFAGMVVAQPAAAGPGDGPGGPPGDAPGQGDGDDVDEDESPEEDSDDDSERGPPEDPGEDVDNESEEVNETEDEDELENESEMDEGGELNETRSPPEGVPGRSAQFDARLMTAINTLEVLVDIAPSDEASSQLQEALDIMRDVQNSTDTASLGPEEDDNETGMNETEDENESVEDDSEADFEDEDSGNQGRRGGGPPGFVRNFIGGLFGR